MNTHHIQYFYDAFRLKSVVASAEVNFVAPSTVSQAISILEEELGFPLTIKKKGSLEFTEAGALFSSEALELLSIVNRAKEINSSHNEIHLGTLRVGTHQSFLNASLWKVLRQYKKEFPKVTVQISTGLGSNISEMIDRDMIDLAITADELAPHTAKHLKSILIHQGNFRLVHAKKFKGTKEYPCIVTNTNKPEVAYLIKKAPTLVIESQVPSWTTIKKILQHEALLGYLPDYLINEDNGKNQFKEVSGGKLLRHPYELRAWYSQKFKHPFLLNKFLEMVQKHT